MKSLKEYVIREGFKLGKNKIEKLQLTKVENLKQLKEIVDSRLSKLIYDFSDLDVSDINSFENLFYAKTQIKELNLTNWDTYNVTNMSNMFKNCSNLTKIIGLREFDMRNVTNITSMFSGCDSLENLNDIEYWYNTNKIQSMNYAFMHTSIASLDLSSWNLKNLENCAAAFTDCEHLENLNISSFKNSSKLFMITAMFRKCVSLNNIIGIENLNVSKISSTQQMFRECESLKTIDLSHWNIDNLSDCSFMFWGCSSLDNIGEIDFSEVKRKDKIFEKCPKAFLKKYKGKY